MQSDRPSTSVSKTCHGRGLVSAARASFSLSFSLLRKDESPVFAVDTCVESLAYQQDHLPTGIQEWTGAGSRAGAPVLPDSDKRTAHCEPL